MSVQPTTPPDSHSLLAVVSSIMDFPAPGIASPEDYARLVGLLDTLCPLQHFAMLGLADGGAELALHLSASRRVQATIGTGRTSPHRTAHPAR